jgi:tetratricopeptide (TPR) repeat protein
VVEVKKTKPVKPKTPEPPQNNQAGDPKPPETKPPETKPPEETPPKPKNPPPSEDETKAAAMRAAVRRAGNLVDEQRFEQAIEELDHVIATAPQPDAEAYLLRGTCWLEKENYPKAIADFTKAAELAPDNVKVFSRRATAELRKTDYAKAIEDFSTAIAMDPDARDFDGRGVAYMESTNDNAAIDDFSEAIRLAPTSIDPWFHRGMIYLLQKRWTDASRDLNAAFDRAPDDPLILRNLARVLSTAPDASLRDGARAVTLAQQACELIGSNDPDALDVFASALAENARFKEAAEVERKALRMQPDFELKGQYQQRLDLYLAGKPYHEPQ